MISSIRSFSSKISLRILGNHFDSKTSSIYRWGNNIPRSLLTFPSYAPMNNTQGKDIPNHRSLHLSSISLSPRVELVRTLTLNNISDNPGAVKIARRVGRGIGSSKGKTSGRGHKGQKSRSGGGPHPLFEGGQTRFYRRIPKRGFTNVHAEPMVPLNLGTLQDYVDMGRIIPPLSPGDPPLTIKDLVNAGIIKDSSIKHGVKLLARGKDRLRTPLRIEISRASSDAISALETIGGEVTTVHYNKLALRALLKPHKFEGRIMPKRARPPPKLMTYYTSHEKRGYLSPEKQLTKVYANLGSDSKTIHSNTEN